MKDLKSKPVIYMIRHGEKPPKLANGDDQDGLSTLGLDRSQGLVKVFGRDSKYNIGKIIAQHPKDDGGQARPYLTVKPLADSLGPDVHFNHKIHRDDAEAVVEEARDYKGPGNVLICWEHKRLTDIATAFGIAPAPEYPGERFDVIWTLDAPYLEIGSTTSEHVPGLDDKYASSP